MTFCLYWTLSPAVAANLVVGRSGYCAYAFNLGSDYFLHLADPGQVGVDIAFALLVEDPLSVQEYFHDALAARRYGYRCIGTVGSEELIRHPRGGSVVLSRYAVGDFQLDFPFHV